MNYDKLTKEEIIKILDDTLGYIDKQEKEIKILQDMDKILRNENINLKLRINKAIEYIQDRYDGEALTHTFDKDNVKELLKILQGSDKEC